MDKLQKEVEKIFQEVGFLEEFLELIKKEEKSELVGFLERSLVFKFFSIKGIILNWVKVIGSGGNYSFVLGINRMLKLFLDVQIVEVVKEVIKGVELEVYVVGVFGRFVSVYVVIEKDIYQFLYLKILVLSLFQVRE